MVLHALTHYWQVMVINLSKWFINVKRITETQNGKSVPTYATKGIYMGVKGIASLILNLWQFYSSERPSTMH
jgi:hypothetical protein